MTPEEAWDCIENDPDIRSSHRLAISVLEEAAMLAERERCAKIAEKQRADSPVADYRKIVEETGKVIAARIRKG